MPISMSPSMPVRMPPPKVVLQHMLCCVSHAAGSIARVSLGSFILGTVLLLAVAVYRLFLHPLSRIPGPRLAAVTNCWLAYNVRNGHMLQLGKTLHAQYGPAVRVGPNEVWFNTKDAFRLIYSEPLHYLLDPAPPDPTSPSHADSQPGPTNGYEKSSFYCTCYHLGFCFPPPAASGQGLLM